MSSSSLSATVGASTFGECTICLSPLSLSNIYAITKCGHTFHGKCIQKWLKSALSCPTCRTKAYSFNLLKLFFNNDSNDSITNKGNSVAEKDSGDTLSVNRENNSRASEHSSENETDSDNDSEGSNDSNEDGTFFEILRINDGLENDENNSQTSENSNEDETDSDNDSERSRDSDEDDNAILLRFAINNEFENGEYNSQASYNSSEDETDFDNDSNDNDAVSEALSEVSEALSELRAQIIDYKNYYNSLYSESLE